MAFVPVAKSGSSGTTLNNSGIVGDIRVEAWICIP